jgi:hypothetical protein
MFKHRGGAVMTRNLQSEIVELEKLKGVSIATTPDDEAFLIFSYYEKTAKPKALPGIFWGVVTAVFCLCGFLVWWLVG